MIIAFTPILQCTVRSAQRVILTWLIVVPAYVICAALFREEVPDWDGYWLMFTGESDYLGNRDLLFGALLEVARRLFTVEGYESFRILCAAYFLLFLMWLAARVPRQPRARGLSVVLTAAVLISVAEVKFTVQIREGIAFTFIAFALYGLGRMRAKTHLALIAASLWHIGTVWTYFAQFVPNVSTPKARRKVVALASVAAVVSAYFVGKLSAQLEATLGRGIT
jgi:EpsG family